MGSLLSFDRGTFRNSGNLEENHGTVIGWGKGRVRKDFLEVSISES